MTAIEPGKRLLSQLNKLQQVAPTCSPCSKITPSSKPASPQPGVMVHRVK